MLIMDRLYSKNVRSTLLLIQLMLLYLPSLQLFSIQTDNGEIPASLCYFFSICFAPYLVWKLRNINFPPLYITALFVLVFLIAVVNIWSYGLSKSILHWLFGLYLLCVIINVGKDFSFDDWQKILEIGACFFVVLHILFMAIPSRGIVGELFRGYYHEALPGTYGAKLPSITRGGRNLDATWLGLGTFFIKGWRKPICVTYAILFSLFGGSRAGAMAIFFAVLWSLIYDEQYHLTFKNLKWYVLYAAFIIVVSLATGIGQGFVSRFGIDIPPPVELVEIIKRFFNSSAAAPEEIEQLASNGAGPFLSGRQELWPFVPKMIRDNPFGYGVGNAMRVMREMYGSTRPEDVVHNVFMQWTIDEGIIGGIWFVSLVCGFFWSQRKLMFKSPFAGYFLAYILISLVQFHGAEALMLFVLGIYITQSNTKLFRFQNLLNINKNA